MEREYTATAETVEAAIDEALEVLGVQQDAVTYEVLEEPTRHLFNKSTSAVVKVTVREGYLEELEVEEEAEAGTTEEEAALPTLRQDPRDLSDEEIDAIADEAVDVLQTLIGFFEIGKVNIDEYEGDEGEIIFDITGEEGLALLIGHHGRTIDALQVAMSAITTKRCGMHYPLAVDVEGYKHRRKQKIMDIAQRSAERVLHTHRSVSLKPMTPYERRVVHILIRNTPGVASASEGNGAYRHVVISPTK